MGHGEHTIARRGRMALWRQAGANRPLCHPALQAARFFNVQQLNGNDCGLCLYLSTSPLFICALRSSSALQVCYASEFGDSSAHAACRSLGYPYGRMARPYNAYGPGSGPILLNAVQCSEEVAEVASCFYQLGPDECLHVSDVGVECFSEPPPGAAAWRCAELPLSAAPVSLHS